jgi:hypothetical protein
MSDAAAEVPDAPGVVETAQPRRLTHTEKFLFGGLGGLLPLLAGLAVIDLPKIFHDSERLTAGDYAGFGLHVLIIGILGGIVTILHTEVKSPTALIQLRIAAPAIIATYASNVQPAPKPPLEAGAKLEQPQPPQKTNRILPLVSPAYGADFHHQGLISKVAFLDDVGHSVLNPIGVLNLAVEKAANDANAAAAKARAASDADAAAARALSDTNAATARAAVKTEALPSGQYSITSRVTGDCFQTFVGSGAANSDSLRKSFPPDAYTVQLGICSFPQR